MTPSISFPSRFSIFDLRSLCEFMEINPDGTKRASSRSWRVNGPFKEYVSKSSTLRTNSIRHASTRSAPERQS